MNETMQTRSRPSWSVPLYLLLGVLFAFPAFVLVNVLKSPWTDFNFATPVDFAIPAFIVAMFLGLLLLHRRRPCDRETARYLRWIIGTVNIVSPFVFLASLYAMSNYAATILGHTPRVMLDDPKNILANDAHYRHLVSLSNYAYAASGGLVYASFGLLAYIWRSLHKGERIGFFATLLGAWLLMMMDSRFSWWLD